MLPFVALAFAALIAGPIGLRSTDAFCAVRPAESRMFAAAKLLAQSRALALTAVVVLLISVAAFAAFGTADLRLVWDAVNAQNATALDLLTILTGPFLLTAIAVWLLLNIRTVAILALPTLILVLAVAVGGSHYYLDFPADDAVLPAILFWCVTTYMLTIPPLVYARALRNGAIARHSWRTLLPAWLIGGAVLWLYSALERPSFPLFLFHLGLMGFLLIPFAAVPIRIDRARHG